MTDLKSWGRPALDGPVAEANTAMVDYSLNIADWKHSCEKSQGHAGRSRPAPRGR